MGDRQTLIDLEVKQGVATIVLNNPPANAYSYELMRQLDDAVLTARMDERVHVIMITGAGDKFFCAGADVGTLQEVTSRYKYYFCLHANETLIRLEQTPKLTIAALNGHAVGGGLEVALACDLRVAAGHGKIGLPEVKLGVLPGTGGTQRLARLVGRSRAIEIMTSGENFSMEQAKQLGLVNAFLGDGDFRSAAHAYAMRYTPPNKASRAVGLIKRAVCSGIEVPLESGLALERELQQQLFDSADAKEGIVAFNEKRQPEFTGR